MPRVAKQKRPVKSAQRRRKSVDPQSVWPDQEEGIKINLYGKSGTGKTTLWATFPKPIHAFICSGGKKPGELRSIDTPENRKLITPEIIQESTDISKRIDGGIGHCKTVVLEHATGLQDLVLKEILGLDELPAQLSWGIARQQDWGQCALQLKEILRALLNLDQNVVIIAQERSFNTDNDGAQSSGIIMPYVAGALTPSVVGWLNPACDYICQTFIRQKVIEREIQVGKKMVKKRVPVPGQVEYCLRTGPDAVYTTKFRLPKRKGSTLPQEIVDPDYGKLMALIRPE